MEFWTGLFYATLKYKVQSMCSRACVPACPCVPVFAYYGSVIRDLSSKALHNLTPIDPRYIAVHGKIRCSAPGACIAACMTI